VCEPPEWLLGWVQDKPALFRRFFQWLKPGGRLLISDYCKGKEASSPDFLAYVQQRGYDLHDTDAYGQVSHARNTGAGPPTSSAGCFPSAQRQWMIPSLQRALRMLHYSSAVSMCVLLASCMQRIR
jgi:hypothetical protein